MKDRDKTSREQFKKEMKEMSGEVKILLPPEPPQEAEIPCTGRMITRHFLRQLPYIKGIGIYGEDSLMEPDQVFVVSNNFEYNAQKEKEITTR